MSVESATTQRTTLGQRPCSPIAVRPTFRVTPPAKCPGPDRVVYYFASPTRLLEYSSCIKLVIVVFWGWSNTVVDIYSKYYYDIRIIISLFPFPLVLSSLSLL